MVAHAGSHRASKATADAVNEDDGRHSAGKARGLMDAGGHRASEATADTEDGDDGASHEWVPLKHPET